MTTTSLALARHDVPSRAATATLALTLLASSTIHVVVVREHLGEWVPAGVFFGVLAAVQLGAAVTVLRRWDRTVASLVVLVSLATVATWLLSRTSGLPFAPDEMRGPEPVGLLDAVCCAAELAAAGVAIACWPLRGRAGRLSTR